MSEHDEHTPGELTEENATRIGTIKIERPPTPRDLRMWPERILNLYPNLTRSPYTGVGVHSEGLDCPKHGCVAFDQAEAERIIQRRKKGQ